MKKLIKNARIVDGTGSPWYKGDILIKDGKIEKIGMINSEDAEIINAEGKYAAPGFIDAHSHSDSSCPFFTDADSKVIQGVTTEVTGMCGSSTTPLKNNKKEALDSLYRKNKARIDIAKNWSTYKDYAGYVNGNGGISTDMAMTVGHGTIRASAMGYVDRKPTEAELDDMKGLLDEALSQGALGMSSGLIYPPGMYSKTEELIELAKVAAKHGKIYMTHMRNEADELIPALLETIEIGEKSGCKVHVAHHKAAGKKNHGKVKLTLALMEEARQRGVDITCDAYPYFAGSCPTVTLLPPWAHVGGREKLLERLRDPDACKRILEDLERDISGWENMGRGSGWDGILICSSPANTQYEGKTLAQIAEMENKTPPNALLSLLERDETRGQIASFGSTEEDNFYVYQHRLTMVGSDSSGDYLKEYEGCGKPHPRTFGTFPRVIGYFARDKKLFPLETAVYKMTGFPASIFNFSDRGIIREGMRADITIFDYNSIIDNSTYMNPRQAPKGIEHVIMCGESIVSGGVYNGKKMGKILGLN